jgi:AcrR family transcriptional regulator
LRATAQRDRIRGIAAELFAAKGYNGVGVAELGDAAGLGRGALYHHIGSKEDLLYEIASRYMVELIRGGQEIAASTPEPVERVMALGSHLMSTIVANLAEMTVCFREVNALTGHHHKTVSKYHSDYQKLWEDVIALGVARGVFRPVDRVTIKGLLGMYFYSFLWLRKDGYHSPEKIGKIFGDIVVRSLAA